MGLNLSRDRITIALLRTVSPILNILFLKAFTRPRALEYRTKTDPPHRCLVYYPPDYDDSKIYPVYIDFHGGGFIGGNPEDDADFCGLVAKEANCIVISSKYRYAPEFPYPTGLMDCYQVVNWIRKEFEPTKFAVGGFSVGGTLALVH
jgi:acetyl esterase/lipase